MHLHWTLTIAVASIWPSVDAAMHVKLLLCIIFVSSNTFFPTGISSSGVKSWEPKFAKRTRKLVFIIVDPDYHVNLFTWSPLHIWHGWTNCHTGQTQICAEHNLIQWFRWPGKLWWHSSYFHIQWRWFRMLSTNTIFGNAFIFSLIFKYAVINLKASCGFSKSHIRKCNQFKSKIYI